MSINVKDFSNALMAEGTDFFTGVPDSLLKNFCAYLTDNLDERHHIIAANEGGAVGLAAGHFFASNRIPLVYMQNSGEGNAVNPLLSLADEDVYQIPILLLIGWRGEPGVHDEPQHVKQGKVTLSLLEAIKIPYSVLSFEPAEAAEQISSAYADMRKNSRPYALVVRKGLFEDYTLAKNAVVSGDLSREEAIEAIVDNSGPDDIFVSTTGMASRELYEIRDRKGQSHKMDFLTVGSMGHASQIALGIALEKPSRRVVCIDGDGAAIMHMGSMAITAQSGASNLVHVIVNNGAHDSVGGQPTLARKINLAAIARALGYRGVVTVSSVEELKEAFSSHVHGPYLIEVLVHKGARKDLGRPKTTPVENKHDFMEFVKER